MNLQNKIVVITGAGRGLGKILANGLARRGAKVVVSGKDKNIEDVAKEVQGLAVVTDVTKGPDIARLAETTLNKFGQIDIWINNAGLWMAHAPIEEMDWARVHDLMEVNFFGTAYGSKTALVQMKKQKYGTIVNILSTSALSGRPFSSGYCASKFAADGFTKSLRGEVSGTPIKVIGVYPGGMKTNLFDDNKPDDFASYMNPEDVAERIIANFEKDIPEEGLIIKRK